jgi:hypothetical protein
MNRFLVRLYPAAWRERYGEEFLVLLEERPVGPFDVADVVLGALDARLRFGRPNEGERRPHGFLMSLRIGGIAALLGSGLAVTALIVGTGLVDIQVEPAVGMAIMTVGLIAMLVALVGLSAFQARSHPRLAWAACAVPALGLVASLVGVAGLGLNGDDSWWIWFGGVVTFFIGSALFALATFRTRALSRRASALLGIGSVLPFAGFITPVVGLFAGTEALFQVAGFGVFALGWAALGLEAVRLDRPAAAIRPA